jgi:hypothetical protein
MSTLKSGHHGASQIGLLRSRIFGKVQGRGSDAVEFVVIVQAVRVMGHR